MPERAPNPLVELTLARLREFLREPEAVFWVFAFPVLMALALGVAFRSERTQEVVVGVRAHGGQRAVLGVLRRTPGVPRARARPRATWRRRCATATSRSS